MACPRIPRATYRLQFHKGFTFADATAIVPYLASLGISHVYASPYLRARPGSLHGYDIIDHNAINPEVGDEESFAAFCAALADHDMGQILDFVPNHVGIFGSENRRFLDVLAWGEESPFAEFFDIDWRPAKPELHGKLLVPLLGDHYGAVLTNGELRLAIDPGEDGFSVWYYDNRLPLCPATYARILRPAMDRLLQDDDADAAQDARLALLAAGFDELRHPVRTRTGRLARIALAERLRGDLGELVRTSPRFRRHLEVVLIEVNGVAGQAATFRRLHQLLEAQHFRLAYWRVAAEEINYRRFFQINDLAGIRVEVLQVFEAIHGLVFRWIDEGRLHGLRIDHVDGLFEPRQYLQRLQNRNQEERVEADGDKPADGQLYVVIEKILAPHEALPGDWPVAGTTGYEFLNRLNGLFVDPDGEAALSAAYQAFVGEVPSFRETAYRGRKLAMEQELASELRVLANEINKLTETNWFTRDYTLVGLRQALRDIVASFPVYRTYVDWHGIRPEDRRDIDWAVAHGRRRSERSDLNVFDFLQALLTTDLGRGRTAALSRREVRRLAMKFQQYTGAVMAKGLEDTAFYRYNRLLSLNEVGGDPTRFGTTVSAFHRANQDTAKRWPQTMLASATHDTKRGEDTRARINVLSELADDWSDWVQRWSTQNRRHKPEVNGKPVPCENDEYLFYQSLIGVWPHELVDGDLDPDVLDRLRERMSQYMLKAVREAKVNSSWTNQDPAYEEALTAFVERALDGQGRNPFLESLVPVATRVALLGALNGLAQTTLKLTVPGMPDIYQGCELWDLSLVDPDNRRPVDFALRANMLNGLRQRWPNGLADAEAAADLLEAWPTGAIKLYVTLRLLHLRRASPAVFAHGGYRPLDAEGARAGNVCAFMRVHDEGTALVVVPRVTAKLSHAPASWPIGRSTWEDTTLSIGAEVIPEGLRNVFTGEPLVRGEVAVADGSAVIAVGDLLANFPVGVWA